MLKKLLLALFLSLVYTCTLADVIDGVEIGKYGLADMTNKTSLYGVGVFGVCWSAFNHRCFGSAYEAWLTPGSMGPVVGTEVSVISEEPAKIQPKIILNLVWKQAPDGQTPAAGANENSIGLWFTSQPNTGVPYGIKFQAGFLQPTRSQPIPAAIDVTEVSEYYFLKGMCGTRLCGIKLGPRGMETHFLD